MVRTLHFHCGGLGSIPGWGTKIPQAKRHGQKKRKENGHYGEVAVEKATGSFWASTWQSGDLEQVI